MTVGGLINNGPAGSYSPWADLASRRELTLIWERLDGHLGEYIHPLRLIRLHSGMRRRQARCVLAHELLHHDHGDVGPCTPAQEERADRGAARRLIEVRALADAAVAHDLDHRAVAHELHVTRHLLEVRLAHLHPSEAHYLRRRIEER